MNSSDEYPQLNPGAEQRLRRATRHVLPSEPGAEVVEQALATFKVRQRPERAVPMDNGTRPSRDTRRSVSRLTSPRRTSYALWSALCIGIVFLGSVAYWQFHALQTPDAQRYATMRGEQSTVTLQDGSVMTLAPASSAEVTIGKDGERSVQLEGSAFFDVVHDHRRSFVVRAGTSTTTVLGTQFAVRKYTEDSAATVAVTQGKVSVNALLLTPGEMATVNLSGSVDKQSLAEAEGATAWTDGRLIFRNIRLSDLAAEIYRWYNLQIVITDAALARQRVHVVLSSTELSDDRLAVLASGIGAQIVRTDSIITISPQ